MENKRPTYLLKTETGEIPKEFDDRIIGIVHRILSDSAVLGIIYFINNFVHICTVPGNMRRALNSQLPKLNQLVHTAVMDLNVQDEMIAYRIETKTCEILVAGDKDMGAVVVQTRSNKKAKKKKAKHGHLH